MRLDLTSSGGGIQPEAEIWYPASTGSEQGSWPVLLYFPGWDGTRIDSPAAVDALVSHGFAVVTVIYPAKLPGETPSQFARQIAELKRPIEFSTDAIFRDSMRRANDRVHARARDAIRVLDTLESAAGTGKLGQLARRMNFGKVGIFGYSFGGAVAAQAAWMDPRFKAAANLDGWQFGEAAEYGVEQPYMYMSDSTGLPSAAELHSADPAIRNQASLNDLDYRRTLNNMSRHGGIYAVLAGTTHGTIADGYPRWPVRLLVKAGLMAPPRIQQTLSTCLIEFFQQSLGLRADQPINGWAERFPQLQVKIYPRPKPDSPPLRAGS